MINTAAIPYQSKQAPLQRGQAGTASDSTPGQDFAAALNRLAYSSLSAAAALQAAQIPDTTRAQPGDDRAADHDDRRSEPAREIGANDAPAHPNKEANRTEEPETAVPSEYRADHDNRADQAGSDLSSTAHETPEPAQSEEFAAAVPTVPVTNAPAPAAAQHGVERTALPVGQAAVVKSSDTETPPPVPQSAQQARQGTDADGKFPKAQILDGGEKDQLPQLSHTLSSRAAIVAQSESTKSAQTAEGGAKNALADPAASSLFGNAAQSASQAAQKAKGQGKAGTNGSQNAAATQGGQSPVQPAQPQAAIPVQQQNLSNPQLGTGNGANTSGQQTLAARTEQPPLAGTGQTAPQFNIRNAAPAPKAPPPVPPRFVTSQVAVQIQKALGEGGDRISIQLKPADLGRVEVRLDIGADGRVAAVITADRADTLDLLQRDARILQNSLQGAGLQADSNSLSFELKGQNHAFGDTGKESAGRGGGSDTDGLAVENAIAAASRSGIISDTRVDIQV
jgi:flagellar hook-length control protein FliK